MNQSVPVSISLESGLAEVAERLRRSTVEVRGADASRGSGVIWSREGLIVTNAHVATAAWHTVVLADGRAFKAEVLARDPRRDLALLQIPANGLPAVQTRNPASLRAGEVVLAVGNPMGATGALAVGLVSAVPKNGETYLRADIRLAPGNSGGPLADADGRVVGINSMIVGGFGIAITATAAEQLVASSNGQNTIGVTVQPVGVRVEGSPTLGLMIVGLESGGLAHLAGALIGDIIVRVNGAWLGTHDQLSEAIRTSAKTVRIDVLRAGKLQAIELRMNRERAAEVA
jgi:serine protease Do